MRDLADIDGDEADGGAVRDTCDTAGVGFAIGLIATEFSQITCT